MRSLFKQSPQAQWLLLESLVVVCAFRLALWILPFKRLIKVIEKRKSDTNDVQVNVSDVRKIAASVRRASHYVPAATCLTQALATALLLRRIGVNAFLRIGVAKGSKGQLEAHAWLESNGKIIIGKEKDLYRYTVIARLGELNQ